MSIRNATSFLLALALLGSGTPDAHAQQGTQSADPALAAMAARSIGPAGMSGRVSDVDVVLSNPATFFVGSATGGVWRTTDGGLTWDPVFDEQPVLGVGAVQIFQPDPRIIWVGTGEGNPRNSAGVGAGIFVSRDGGDTWTRTGLEESERIHRIVVHPTNPDIVWAAALGPAWSDGQQRGVFKTTDGGQNWERVLFTNERSGAAELVIDPTDPDRLVAAMWEYRREPWFFESGGPGSGLYVSEDAGETWTQRTAAEGMPSGHLGRMGLAFAASEPGVLYALVEAEKSALLRSDDHGATFALVTDRDGIAPRPFYYADIRVDPTDASRLYSLHSQIQVSEDGGESFRTVVPSQIIHGDVHELWIHPDDPTFMIMGNDGGIAITQSRGETWRFVENLTLAQFYHISIDNAVPFNVYGGLQDNGSWFGPSTVWENRGIMNAHWRRVGGGDGFSVMPDFADMDYGYAMSQGGNLTRFDRLTGARKSIRPVHPEGLPLRFNWNAALTLDPIDSTTIYLGSQYVHRSRDHGATWEIISGDLTTDDPSKQRQSMSGGLSLDATGAENHTTIVTIAPSSLDAGTIWVGSDDGRVHITRDSGESWTEVGTGIQGAPADTWVAHIEASRHHPGRAYVVMDDHRRGNWETLVYRTDDFGATWTRLSHEEVFGFAHVVEEDPAEEAVLYLGTEFGLYVSLDGGSSWNAWRSGVPAVPIRDIAVHPRDLDLVLGTHGRGILVLDDVRPLHQLARTGTPNSLTLFDPPPAIAAGTHEAIGYRSTGHAMQFGEMRPYGALLTFWHEGTPQAYQIEVNDSEGNRVGRVGGRATPGMNRTAWNLRLQLEDAPGARPLALPGEYTAVVTIGDESAEASFEVHPDPRRPFDVADRRAKIEALRTAGRRAANTQKARGLMRTLVQQLERADGQMSADAPNGLREQLTTVRETVVEFNERAFTGPSCQGICGGSVLQSAVMLPMRTLNSSWSAPTDLETTQMAQALRIAIQIAEETNALLRDHVQPLSEALEAAGFDGLNVPDPLELPR